MPGFRISPTPIDVAALRGRMLADGAGAYASFEGWVRDSTQGRGVLALVYEAYGALAQAEGENVLAEAREKFAIIDAACVHRVGELAVGELAVWVGVSAAHRDAAFAACRYVIDELKARVPIWKRERYADGEALWQHP
jgi:molybdopterin synthase catalytic subunit